MLKKTILLLVILLNAIFFIGCDDSDGSDIYILNNGSTELVYEADNVAMSVASMLYSLEIGPIDVSDYRQIRIVTFVSDSSTVAVSISELDEEGEDMGYLDQFTLDSGNDYRVTSVYDVPGQSIQISYSSSSPGDKNITCLVYGR